MTDPTPPTEFTRRELLTLLGAGLLVAVISDDAEAQPANPRDQRGGAPARPAQTIATRLHLSPDGTITVMSGKVEGGQGVRAQITQAAAEELHVPPTQIRVLLGDTELCPDDGPTVGSRSTSRTIPSVRQGAAAGRDVLVGLAASRWGVDKAGLIARDGAVHHPDGRRLTYGEIAGDDQAKAFTVTAIGEGVEVTHVNEWKVLGVSLPRPNGRDIVTGAHRYPSGIDRPGMLFGKVLRPPATGATLAAIDLSVVPAETVVTREGNFVGVAAKNSALARQAIDALAKTATWKRTPQVSSPALFEHLRKTCVDPTALVNPYAGESAAKTLRREYRVAFAQHAPLEPRAAVAEWDGNKLTVWTATQNPTRVRTEVAEAFGLTAANVRIIVPDFGGAFGGKHTGESAVEAARLAKAAGRPVSLVWTREEEFQWASFRPAALILAEATLEDDGAIASWMFTNVNSGPASLRSPYRTAKRQEKFAESKSPLRHGSYRALAATANTFARECFIDELAEAAGVDPLAYRLAHLETPRIANVLRKAADGFGWAQAFAEKRPNTGVGLACGTEKASFVAACAEVNIDPATQTIRVVRVRQAYDCGKVQNPAGLLAQVQGAIVQGLGPALWEAIELDNGRVTNGNFEGYRVPRFGDVPRIDIDLIDDPSLPSVGGSETPIIAIAPAIANAVRQAVGRRVYEMPIKL